MVVEFMLFILCEVLVEFVCSLCGRRGVCVSSYVVGKQTKYQSPASFLFRSKAILYICPLEVFISVYLRSACFLVSMRLHRWCSM